MCGFSLGAEFAAAHRTGIRVRISRVRPVVAACRNSGLATSTGAPLARLLALARG